MRGDTFATIAESEYSLFSDDVDKTHKDEDLDLDDSLSSHEESNKNDADHPVSCSLGNSARRGLTSKIPSSLHIPSVLEGATAAAAAAADNEEDEDEEEVGHSTSETEVTTTLERLPETEDPVVLEENAADVRATTCSAPKRKSQDMMTYRPTDRSISVALSPSRPSLRILSKYGNDSTIPLDFNNRTSVRVLPKPDLQAIGQSAIQRRASTPSFSTTSQRPSRRSVAFDKIGIREHRVTLGDNPSCSYGTPISLDWDYIDFEELSLEDYELHKSTTGRGRSRTLRELYLNHYQRVHRLKIEGYSDEQIKERKKETTKARKQRDLTRFKAQNQSSDYLGRFDGIGWTKSPPGHE